MTANAPKRAAVRIRRCVRVSVCAWLLLAGNAKPLAAAQGNLANEYGWKANFLAKTANFIEWSGDSPLQMANAFRWCVYGTFSFGTSLAEITRDISVNGKRSEVKWIHKEAELNGCQIIFVSRSEQSHYAKVLDAARPGRGLTVGETPDFLEAGGMVTLLTEGKTPAFEVNLEAVTASRLKLSSRLLTLARRVVNRTIATQG